MQDWVDGKALCHFVESQVPGTIPNYNNISELSPYERARLALENAEEKLGIKKIITAEEIVDNVDELPLMAYVLQVMMQNRNRYNNLNLNPSLNLDLNPNPNQS